MIDWEAAKSGKRLLWTGSGCPGRYVGPLAGNRHIVAFKELLSDSEYAMSYRNDGICLGAGPHLIQDPEVIEWTEYHVVYNKLNVSRYNEREFARAGRGAACNAPIVPVTYRITGDKVEIFGGTE